MEMTIKSRKLNTTFIFFLPLNENLKSYIFVQEDSEDLPGILGKQICHGGGYIGNCVSADEATFEEACRKWYRQNLAYILKGESWR